MALLTKGFDNNPLAWLAPFLEAQKDTQRVQEARDRALAQSVESVLASQRRAQEFQDKLQFDYAAQAQSTERARIIAAEDRRRWEFENAPIPALGGVTPAQSVVQAVGAPAVSAPAVSIPAVEPALPEPAMQAADAPATGIPEPTGVAPTGNIPAAPAAPAPVTSSIVEPPPAPAAPAATPPGGPIPGLELMDQSPASQVVGAVSQLQKAGIPVNRRMVQSMVPSMMSAAMANERKKTSAAATASEAAIAKWPINERGYRFNPDAPEQQFMERHTPRGTTYTQVKPTDPGYGLNPVGDGLFEDRNGAQYYVEEVRKGSPVYKRVEEDKKVAYRATDQATGRVVSYNRFGREVGVTDERYNFMTPKSKLMVGSDGNVYPYDQRKNEWIVRPPTGVTFDGGRNSEAKIFRTGSDGKMYAFGRDGTPLLPIPDAVRFDRVEDPEKVAKWEVDEKTGDLHGFNYKGEKIVQNEGDYAKLSQSARDRQKDATLTEQATYEAIAPTVKGLWRVMDEIRSTGLSPHADHAELVATLGERGRQLSSQRKAAQDAVGKLQLGRQKKGRDFAEGFVRAFETKYGVPGAAPAAAPAAPAVQAAPAGTPTPTPTPAPAAAPAPAAPASPAVPTSGTVWLEKDGYKWEYDAATKKPTGRAVKL